MLIGFTRLSISSRKWYGTRPILPQASSIALKAHAEPYQLPVSMAEELSAAMQEQAERLKSSSSDILPCC